MWVSKGEARNVFFAEGWGVRDVSHVLWGGRLYNLWKQMCAQLCQRLSGSTSFCKSNVSIWQNYDNSNRCKVYRGSIQPTHAYRWIAVTGTKRYSTRLICEKGFKYPAMTTPCTARDELAAQGQGCASWHCEKRAKVHCTEQASSAALVKREVLKHLIVAVCRYVARHTVQIIIYKTLLCHFKRVQWQRNKL